MCLIALYMQACNFAEKEMVIQLLIPQFYIQNCNLKALILRQPSGQHWLVIDFKYRQSLYLSYLQPFYFKQKFILNICYNGKKYCLPLVCRKLIYSIIIITIILLYCIQDIIFQQNLDNPIAVVYCRLANFNKITFLTNQISGLIHLYVMTWLEKFTTDSPSLKCANLT